MTSANVRFPPIPNGVDYLVSVVELLSGDMNDPNPRDFKYAVLHLQAASEVLLKSRLQIEHWTLVVKDATKTNETRYRKGDFESTTHSETMRRLVDVVGIDISDGDKRALQSLAKTRNSLQHWGLTESVVAIETRAADVLDFLIRFLDEYLLAALTEDELAEIEDDMRRVREGLTGIKSFTKSRMERLRSELEYAAEYTVQCPDCGQFALVIDGGEGKCHFCGRLREGGELAEDYAFEILHFSWHDVKEGADPIVVECPSCDLETLVLGAVTAAQSHGPVKFCFNCAESFHDLDSCTRCGRPYMRTDGSVICGHCWNDLINSD